MNSDILFDRIGFEAGSDLAGGKSVVRKLKHGLIREDFSIKDISTSRKLAKPIGDYTLLTIDSYTDNVDKVYYIIDILSKILGEYIGDIDAKRVLVVGLGNRYITADTLGHEVVSRVVVSNKGTIVNAIVPSVKGLTGIESCDIVEGVVKKTKPDVVVVVDSLCASDIKRIGTCIQFSNGGMTPGSGIRSPRRALSSKNLRCRVVSIGVPFVVYVSTIIDTMFGGMQGTMQRDKVARNKAELENMVMTPSDIDVRVEELGKIISTALNKTLLGVDGYSDF